VLSSKANLNRHLKSVHKIGIRKIFECYFCPTPRRTYYDNTELFNHIRGIHLKELPYKCRRNANCARRFATVSNASTSHTLCITKEGRNILNNKQKVCYFCSKTFHQFQNLRFHLCEHTLEAHYTCALCQNPFYTSTALKYHILSVHLKERFKGLYSCPTEYSQGGKTYKTIIKTLLFLQIGFCKNL